MKDQEKKRGEGNVFFRKAAQLVHKCTFFKENEQAQLEFMNALIMLALNTKDKQEKCKYFKMVLKIAPTDKTYQVWDIAKSEYSKLCR